MIVAGRVYVDPRDRERFVEEHRGTIEAARNAPGCLDMAISPDPVDPARVNIFEHFETAEALEYWRATAPVPEGAVAIEKDQVLKHEISASGPPFD
ncbi:putative quinol monooxygenase [Nocardiopsis potens]|uniref:putative quinol monooxygenase n=1 Tax=Nocardiopsis potens TaxID=1246458 RepID=UPI001F4CBD37|nr:antibiotic biosynthesis monooxygenase family protein [Nocardiopsis potens]